MEDKDIDKVKSHHQLSQSKDFFQHIHEYSFLPGVYVPVRTNW